MYQKYSRGYHSVGMYGGNSIFGIYGKRMWVEPHGTGHCIKDWNKNLPQSQGDTYTAYKKKPAYCFYLVSIFASYNGAFITYICTVWWVWIDGNGEHINRFRFMQVNEIDFFCVRIWMQMVLQQEKGGHYAQGVICSLYTYFLVEAITFICARM